ncbi:MAG: hypothetical protein F6K25_20230 [Okeania sp. SIO2G4]|uniref:hypothetical protein n=1 Tax=unclassified Okeania TaxID=2634635 RepID=UPI0013B79629|nr:MULTISPECIES: hypothetical protein [unclassified Okeania]NEP38997.1 hypothetical protein [Okeania sp. SIO2H7]NEP75122.1 hypothetical protein [Okeania sp. SIO2G5]NEP94512.1 hypothetical protein [Okeania sp. SIO2F5]NEQ92866.1 hypothetical protein [Okeania sp. SIO2G4]
MVSIPSIEILQLNSETVPEGISYYPSLNSDETMIATYPPNTMENLYVHRNQTDYIKVVRGQLIWVILSEGKYQSIRSFKGGRNFIVDYTGRLSP